MTSETQSVNYESPPLVEHAIGGTDYRLDSGKQGTALCISTRASGTWDWGFLCEAKWDGSLRSKGLERPVLQELSKAFALALEVQG